MRAALACIRPNARRGDAGLAPICRWRRWRWSSCCSWSCRSLTIVVVSFFDYNTTQIIPDFLLQNYEELLLSPVTWRTYLQTAQVRRHHLGADPADRLHRRLFPRLPRPLADLADGAVPGLHHPVLDLQHHPHDLVDPVPRPQRARQHHAAAARPDPRAARVPAVLRLRRRAGLCPPLHAVHGGADLQLDDAHRPQSCSRRRATPAPPAGRRCATSSCRCASPASPSARSSSSPRHGRLRHRAHDERRPERLGRR